MGLYCLTISAQCYTLLMAASLPRLSFIQYWLPRGLELTPLKTFNMVSKALQEGLPLTAPALLGAFLILTLYISQGSSHLYSIPDISGSLLHASILAFAQAVPLAWPLSTTHIQGGEFMCSASLSVLTSFPLWPGLVHVGLEWNQTVSWERSSIDMFTQQKDG